MPRNRIILIAIATGLVIVAGSSGYVIGQLTSYSRGNYASRYGNSPGGNSRAYCSGSSSPSCGGGEGAQFSSMSLAQSIAMRAGTRLAGKAPQTVSTSQVQALSEQAPAGARIDRSADTITFTGTSASFTVVAIAPGGRDMTFGIGGLTNPTVIVPQGARVTVRFINNDTNEAHGWLVTAQQPPFDFGQSVMPAINGASAGVIGDPTAAGDGASTIIFQASTAGSYQYICPMPGHAQMGMHGRFVVR
jgi:rusticyanin